MGRMLFFGANTGSILKASNNERQEAIQKLIGTCTFKKGYYLLLILAVMIITPGLVLNNASVIIGGMLLSPLLVPILLLSLSIVSGSARGILHAMQVLALSLFIILSLSAILSWIIAVTSPVRWIPDDISPELYFFIAFCSGIAAAFAWVKEDLAPTIAGVAISISLLPPVCAAGIGLAFADITLARNSFLLFASNVFGILLAAVIIFVILGFVPLKKAEEKALSKEGVE